MTNEVATMDRTPMRVMTVPKYEDAILQLQARHDLVLQMMDNVLKPGVHHGLIPGCGTKPSLFLPGAEVLAATFQFCPRYKVEKEWQGQHLTVTVICELYLNLTDGVQLLVAEGAAICSTYESKYRYRGGVGESTGMLVPTGYWDKRKSAKPEDQKKAQEMIGGPGFTVSKLDESGTPTKGQGTWTIMKVNEKMENPDLADQWNTVVKMGCKRAFVHSVRTATGTADVFTQDLEDFRDNYGTIIDAEVVPPTEPTAQTHSPNTQPSAATPPQAERGWTTEMLEQFVDLRDNILYSVFKDGGHPEMYQAEADIWNKRKATDEAQNVINGMVARVTALQDALNKAKSKAKPQVAQEEPPEPDHDDYEDAPPSGSEPKPTVPVITDGDAATKKQGTEMLVAACMRFETEFAKKNVKDPKAQVVAMRDRVLGNLNQTMPKAERDPYLDPFTRAYTAATTKADRLVILAQAMDSKADQLKVPALAK